MSGLQHYFELDRFLQMLIVAAITATLMVYLGYRRPSYTILPELPSNFRSLLIDDIHSSQYTSKRAFPRTDLVVFEPWQTFAIDIHTAITDAMETQGIAVGMNITLGRIIEEQELVATEADVQQTADTELHKAVQKVLNVLGVQDRFYRSGCQIELIGKPDFSWLHTGTRHPKLVEEFKPEWLTDLQDVPASWQAFNANDRSVSTTNCVEALEQIYGYMTFNNNKYGILTNLTRAWFFQRVEGGGTLHYAGPINLRDSPGSPSMLKAYVGIVLLAEKTPFHASPILDSMPSSRLFSSNGPTALQNRRTAVRMAGNYTAPVKDGAYECLDLDFRLCDFRRSTAQHSVRGFTIEAVLLHQTSDQDFTVMCKAVDLLQSNAAVAALEEESHVYLALHHLQGRFIPKVYGYFNVWGILCFLALEHVGESIGNGPISSAQRRKMEAALSQIHRAGYIHGDIARRNFCAKGTKVFLIDLEYCVETQDQRLMDAEMNQLRAL